MDDFDLEAHAVLEIEAVSDGREEVVGAFDG